MSTETLSELTTLATVSGRGSFAVLLEGRGRAFEGCCCRHGAARRIVWGGLTFAGCKGAKLHCSDNVVVEFCWKKCMSIRSYKQTHLDPCALSVSVNWPPGLSVCTLPAPCWKHVSRILKFVWNMYNLSKKIGTGWNHHQIMVSVFLDHRNVIITFHRMKNILDLSKNFDFSKSKFFSEQKHPRSEQICTVSVLSLYCICTVSALSLYCICTVSVLYLGFLLGENFWLRKIKIFG